MSDFSPSSPPANSSLSSRESWIDQLRILACLAVILIHVSGEAYGRFTASPSWEWWLANIMNGSCRAAVPVFAMISGALMKENDCDPRLFYRKKALRFLPVVLAWTALYGVFDVIVAKDTVLEVAMGFVSRGYVYLHLWYLTMFAFLLAVVPYLAKLRFSAACTPRDWRMLVGLGVLFIVIDWTAQFLCRASSVTFAHWPRNFVEFVPYFMLGAWLSGPQWRAGRSLYGWLLAFALAASWIANFIACRYLGIVNDGMPLSNHSPFVLMVAMAVFMLARTGDGSSVKSPAWLAIAGEATLGVYLLHPIFIWLFRRLVRGSGFDILGGWCMLLTALVVYVVSLACILLLRRFAIGRKIC